MVPVHPRALGVHRGSSENCILRLVRRARQAKRLATGLVPEIGPILVRQALVVRRPNENYRTTMSQKEFLGRTYSFGTSASLWAKPVSPGLLVQRSASSTGLRRFPRFSPPSRSNAELKVVPCP